MRRKRRRRGFARLLVLTILLVIVAMSAKHGLLKINELDFRALLSGDYSIKNSISETDLLVLVNKDNKLPDDYKVDLTKEGAKFAQVMLGDFEDMMGAAASEKVYLYVRDAYRTRAEQEQMFEEKGEKIAARPGHSEHETGLAIDFSLADNQEETNKTYKWLADNAHKYGFILRYPQGKESITGFDYEPWHYRYVGKEHAKSIFEQGLVLEEYLSR